MLERFRADPQMRSDTIRLYLEKGWSLAVCCRDCPRIVEWTPPQLAEKFAGKLDVSIAAIAAGVACEGEGGCGSASVAVFAHPYDDAAWKWSPPADAEA